jgi:hypothetical protein
MSSLLSRALQLFFSRIIKLFIKSGDKNSQFWRNNRGIKHVTENENFTKRNNWDPN